MNERTQFRSGYGATMARYLAVKETLGRQYTTERAVFTRLDGFLAARHADLDAETFAHWCTSLGALTSGVRRARMRIVRNLCVYRRRDEPSCFVPDLALFPPRHHTVQPHIFTADEIDRLLRVVETVRVTRRSPLRRDILRLALVLFYTTGLRRGELLRLTAGDYDPTEGTLLIRESKFHKSRIVPLSPDGASSVDAYLRDRRTHRGPFSKDTPLLGSPYCDGKPFSAVGLREGISQLLRTAGIHTAAGRTPRLHDFRHTFAVHALLRWYQTGADVQAKLPILATFMGHASILSTQYYLRVLDQLNGLASSRFASEYGDLVTPRPSPEGDDA